MQCYQTWQCKNPTHSSREGFGVVRPIKHLVIIVKVVRIVSWKRLQDGAGMFSLNVVNNLNDITNRFRRTFADGLNGKQRVTTKEKFSPV